MMINEVIPKTMIPIQDRRTKIEEPHWVVMVETVPRPRMIEGIAVMEEVYPGTDERNLLISKIPLMTRKTT